MRNLVLVLPVAALALTLSCEKEAAPTTAPEPMPSDAAEPASDGGAEAPEAAAPKTWQDMDRSERMGHMGTVVFPKMKSAFQGHNADAFADFKCQTCHGDDMKEVDFKMPNALTPLSATDPWQSAVDMDEETAKFMAEVVVPQMGEMLNMEVKPDGSGEMNCFACHLKEE